MIKYKLFTLFEMNQNPNVIIPSQMNIPYRQNYHINPAESKIVYSSSQINPIQAYTGQNYMHNGLQIVTNIQGNSMNGVNMINQGQVVNIVRQHSSPSHHQAGGSSNGRRVTQGIN